MLQLVHLLVCVCVFVSTHEDEMSAELLACRDTLRAGKRLLKEKQGAGMHAMKVMCYACCCILP
jgi:hypothetical protein